MMRRTALLVVLVVGLLAASSAQAAGGLAGSWSFDEGAGTIAHDSSGLGNDGTVSGQALWTQGYFGTALSFNGGSAGVHVVNGSSLEPKSTVSVAAWVNASQSPGNYRYIVAKGASSCLAASYGLYTGAGGGLRFYVSRNSGGSYTLSPDGGAGVWNGSWHFVVGTYDGSSVRLYVDGQPVGGGTRLSGAIDYSYPDNDLYIGHYNGCPALDFTGLIDEPQVWARALSASEISGAYSTLVSLHDGGPVVPPAPLPLPVVLSPHPTLSPQPPTGLSDPQASAISQVSGSGLAKGQPRIAFEVNVHPAAPPIKSVALTLPSGLRFAPSLKRIRAGVKVTPAGRYTISVRRGTMTLVLAKPARRLTVTLSAPGIIEAPELIKRVQAVAAFNRANTHGKKKTLTLKLGLRLTDAKRKSAVVAAVVGVS